MLRQLTHVSQEAVVKIQGQANVSGSSYLFCRGQEAVEVVAISLQIPKMQPQRCVSSVNSTSVAVSQFLTFLTGVQGAASLEASLVAVSASSPKFLLAAVANTNFTHPQITVINFLLHKITSGICVLQLNPRAMSRQAFG